jgi:hypothetical protein
VGFPCDGLYPLPPNPIERIGAATHQSIRLKELWGQKDLLRGMQHELFHRYPHDFFDFEASKGYPLWTALWAEAWAQ